MHSRGSGELGALGELLEREIVVARITRNRTPSPDCLCMGPGPSPPVVISCVYCVAGLDELTSAIEIASDHRRDGEPVEEHRAAVLVAERLEESEALLARPPGAGRVSRDGRRAAAGPERVGASHRRRPFRRGMLEERL